ncbi:MAG: Ig-like domain-containing protein [Cytophagaceae bacterium]
MAFIRPTLLIIILFQLIHTYSFSQSCNSKIGINLDGIGGPAYEYPDVFKTAERLRKYPSTSSFANVDANGWPLEDFQVTFFDHRPFGAWAPPADDPDVYVPDLSGVYVLTFTGQANISSWCDAPISWAELNTGKVYNAATNTTTVNITWPSGTSSGGWKYGYFVLNFTNTKITPDAPVNSGVKNIKMIRPGYPASTNQKFSTQFLNALSMFSTIRFMDWAHTNNNGPGTWAANNFTTWDDRQKPDVFPYTKGAPWEDAIELANLTGKDIWINIPVAATDDYVTKLATLIKDNLRSDLNIYIEYSNEVWNPGFTQYQYNESAVLNSPEDEDVRASTPWNDRRRARRVAKKLIKISQIFENVLGVSLSSRSRIRPVFGWQIGGYLVWYQDAMNYVNSAFGTPKNFIYALASAPYFNDSGFQESDTPQQIVTRMSANSDGNVEAVKTVAQYAASFGMLHLQYEGGPDNGGGNATNIGNRIRANRIPQMKTAVIRNYNDNWFSAAANGTAPVGTNDLVNYFVLTGRVSRYGCWGATEDLSYFADLSKAPKLDALCELTGKCTGAPSISITAPSNNATIAQGNPYTFTINASSTSAISRVEYFIDGKLIGSSNTPPYSYTWTASQAGRHTLNVKVINSNCQHAFATPADINVSQVTDIETEPSVLPSFNIYPNPAKDLIIVETSASTGDLIISNGIGTIIKQQKVTSRKEELNLSGLPAGMYFVIHKTGNGERVTKMVVQP